MGYKKTFKYEINNPFGINLKCHIWYDEIKNKNFSSIIDYAQKNIISKNIHLSDSYITKETSYWDKHNIFEDLKYDKTIKNIKKNIKNAYKDFVKSVGEREEEIYINGWLNILPKNGRLLEHLHGNHENSYLSGNLILTETKNSKTSFALPNFDKIKSYYLHTIDSKKGHFNLFPQWLFHWVDPIDEDLRIVLGFDLHLKKAVDYYWKHNSQFDYPLRRAIKLC